MALLRIGDGRDGDVEARPLGEEAEAGRDVGGGEVARRVVDDPPGEERETDHQGDLDDDAADGWIVQQEDWILPPRLRGIGMGFDGHLRSPIVAEVRPSGSRRGKRPKPGGAADAKDAPAQA